MEPDARRDEFRLLMVDDEPLLIRALQRALRGAVEITGAEDGDQAICLLDEHHFDAILAEVSVYDSKGRSFIHRLESGEQRWLDRLILASGGRNLPFAFRIRDRYGCPFMHKPIDPGKLFDVLKRLAASKD